MLIGVKTELLSGGPLSSFSLSREKTFREEFEQVALPQLSHLYTVAFYLSKDKTEAEDLVQEIYLKAFRFFNKFQPGTNCRAWLLSILRNLFVNRYQQRRREPETVDWKKIDQVYESIVERGGEGGRRKPGEHFFLKAHG